VERRRAKRHTVEWSARYRLGASAEWRDCRLIDLAKTGATIEPFGPFEDNSLSGEVEIQIELLGDVAEVFELLGDIRHMTWTSAVRAHLGIEFKNLTRLDVMLLELIDRGFD
jgi:hypothetical protein